MKEFQKSIKRRYKWLEFYKIKFSGEWYTRIVDKLVLRPKLEFGFLGAYNNAQRNNTF